MSGEQTVDLKEAIQQILTKMKARDEENDKVLKKVESDLTEYKKVQEGTKDAVADMNKKGAELQGQLADVQQKLVQLDKAPTQQRQLTPGEEFVKDAGFIAFAKNVRDSSVKGVHRVQVKTITSLPASAGDGVWSTRLPDVVEGPLRPLTIRDLLDSGTTDSGLIEWVKENVFTNNADVVSEGATKPESNITYEGVQIPVRTIAHWIRASKQVLADFKQLQTMINGRLRWGLKIKEEDQLLFGDGTGQNLLGLIPQATSYNTDLNRSNDTMIDTIRHSILQVRLAFYPASGTVLSPVDWHNLELTKDNENRYLMASPSSRTPPMLWGLPVVESDGMAVGEFLTGAFRLAATLFDREQAAILVSTEDGTNFIQNLVTILCEERLALAVSRPAAIVHGGFPAGATT